MQFVVVKICHYIDMWSQTVGVSGYGQVYLPAKYGNECNLFTL